MMIIEFIEKVLKKIYIVVHKTINFKLYQKGVKLYGVPKIVKRNNVFIGKSVRINDNVFIHGAGKVEIKDNVTLSYGVSVISTGYDIEEWEENKFSKIHKNEKIVIGENVWICANATILAGANIEKDVIVSAGAVVTKGLLESGYIYGGIPAKKIKKI